MIANKIKPFQICKLPTCMNEMYKSVYKIDFSLVENASRYRDLLFI